MHTRSFNIVWQFFAYRLDCYICDCGHEVSIPNYSHFRLVRTRLTRNFGLHAQKPLVQNQIALTHILNGLG